MLNQIKGLHHVTSMATDARENNDFFTDKLGLRRVKKTVNFDAPDVYHLYYGDEFGTPGSVMTYFPFPNIGKGRPASARSARPSSRYPRERSATGRSASRKQGVEGPQGRGRSFGENRLHFDGPDGDGFALVEAEDDERAPWSRAACRPTRRSAASIRRRCGCGMAARPRSC